MGHRSHSNRYYPNRYLGIERHGSAISCFDKIGGIQNPPFDRVAYLWQTQLEVNSCLTELLGVHDRGVAELRSNQQGNSAQAERVA